MRCRVEEYVRNKVHEGHEVLLGLFENLQKDNRGDFQGTCNIEDTKTHGLLNKLLLPLD